MCSRYVACVVACVWWHVCSRYGVVYGGVCVAGMVAYVVSFIYLMCMSKKGVNKKKLKYFFCGL